MRVRISTQLPCTAEALWHRLLQPASLRAIAEPILTFHPIDAGAFDQPWQVGRVYPLRLCLFGVVPLGSHTIRIETADPRTRRIESRESGTLVHAWNHRISFEQAAPGLVRYVDEINFEAGWLTPVVWLFAQLFYRHRQRRWNALLTRAGPAPTPGVRGGS